MSKKEQNIENFSLTQRSEAQLSDYPTTRLRRGRRNASMRALLQETHLSKDDVILPLFVEENLKQRTEIESLPGVFRETEESLKTTVKSAWDKGVKCIILFGVSHNKDHEGTDSLKPNGLMARMIKAARKAAPEIIIIADACFCEYTDHGHCGPINTDKNDVDNDRTLNNLAHQAEVAAQAGADIIAPSGMMDGMVAAIREGLDSAGFEDIAIMAYSAKFASHLYGPFREASGCTLDSSAQTGPENRETYQMNPANSDEAMREVEQDILEGADMVMVKPGIAYLDIIQRIKSTHNIPIFAYHVSGEYAMLKAAADRGWLNYEAVLGEHLMALKRAGCTGILTYGALDLINILDKAQNS